MVKEYYTFEDLCAIMTLLRSENGCPWDRAQTHESIRKNLIEECYEALEGIDRADDALLKEELGDILLQIVFHAQIAKEGARFDMDGVINGVCQKLVSRHPHIFAEEHADGAVSALDKWEEMKRREKHTKSVGEDLDRVARTLPSLMRTQKLLKKATKAGLYNESQEVVTKETLSLRYFELCADANRAGIDLEELAYSENEAFIAQMKEKEEHEN